MAAPTLWARCRRCRKRRVSWTLAAEATAPSGRDAVGRDDDMVLGPGLTAVGGIGAGQLAAVLGADRTTVDHHVPGERPQAPRAPCGPARHGPGAAGPQHSSRPGDGARWSRKHARRWRAALAIARLREGRTAAPRQP